MQDILQTIIDILKQQEAQGALIALGLFLALFWVMSKLPTQSSGFEFTGSIRARDVEPPVVIKVTKEEPRYVSHKAKVVKEDTNRFGRWKVKVHTKDNTKEVTRVGMLYSIICPATIDYREIK